jgi:dolichol-phosphate mannosyltransferase
MDLTVVIPVYNEAACIGALLGEMFETLPGSVDYEVIVVDDGSHDDTPAVLQDLCRDHPRLHVLRHARRSGQSAAIGSGVRAARGQWIVTLDGDGQNDPADIMRLYEMMDNSSDQVALINGHRATRRDSALKRFASRVANTVRARVLQDNTPDSACGLRLFARETWLALPQFDHMHRFLPALVQRQGGETRSLAVNHRERRGGKSKYGIVDRLWVGIVDMLGVWWLQRRYSAPVITEIK